MRKLKQTKGITLVALILTIVILLILALVTIRSIQGEGIIAKAMQSREKYEGAADEEQGILDKYLQDMEGISSGTSQDGGSTEEVFNPEEWDKGAASADAFIWKSDDPTSPDYGVVIGYTANVQNYPTLRYPSRCTEITFANFTDINGVSTGTSRGFTNNILKLEIPGTVQSVNLRGGYISGFSKLETVEIEKGVKEILNFSYLYNLVSITIPDTVTTIRASAFYCCDSLTSIKIPGSVTDIENGAFAYSRIDKYNNREWSGKYWSFSISYV